MKNKIKLIILRIVFSRQIKRYIKETSEILIYLLCS